MPGPEPTVVTRPLFDAPVTLRPLDTGPVILTQGGDTIRLHSNKEAVALAHALLSVEKGTLDGR